MAQLRLVETHLNFIFSGLLCPVTCESWFDYPELFKQGQQSTHAHLRARRAAPALARHDTVSSRQRVSEYPF